MITLTEVAKEAIQALTADGPAEAGVRLSTTPTSPDGDAVPVSLAMAEAPEAGDEVIDDDGARVFVEPAAASILGDHLLDAQVDYEAQEVNFFVR
jgi:Fe-S cluster assembly iron-binding protein IscA